MSIPILQYQLLTTATVTADNYNADQLQRSATKVLTGCHSLNSITSTLLNPYRINFRGPVFLIFEDPSLLACDVVSMGEHGTKQPLMQCHIPADTAARPSNLALFSLINESTDSKQHIKIVNFMFPIPKC